MQGRELIRMQAPTESSRVRVCVNISPTRSICVTDVQGFSNILDNGENVVWIMVKTELMAEVESASI